MIPNGLLIGFGLGHSFVLRTKDFRRCVTFETLHTLVRVPSNFGTAHLIVFPFARRRCESFYDYTGFDTLRGGHPFTPHDRKNGSCQRRIRRMPRTCIRMC